ARAGPRLRGRARLPAQPAARRRLPVGRLRAVHATRRGRRGRARRPLGRLVQDRMRYPPVTSALASPALDGLPLTVGLSAREVLLVGCGPVSARRARTFLEAGALVRVVAPELAPEMESLAARAGGAVVVVPRAFTPDDLDTPWMVHVATGDPEVDAEVAALCERQRIWCVTAGDAALGSARVPARTAVSPPSGPVRIAVDSGDPRRPVRVGRHVARSLATEPAGLRARRREDVGWAALVGDCGDGDLLTIRARRLIHAAAVLVVAGAAEPGMIEAREDGV